MNDILQSLNKALARQGWLYGDKSHRLGHPFEWVDGDRHPELYTTIDSFSILLYLSMFYEEYATPDEVLTSDYEQMKGYYEEQLDNFCKHFFPFSILSPTPLASDLKTYIGCHALGRTQDYCFIRKNCKDLTNSIKHLDIGSGLGSHALYSLKGLNSEFYSLEASPKSYAVQRHFLRFISPDPGAYLDLVELENFEVTYEAMSKELNNNSKYKIKHCPSWFFPLIKDKSIDLITATWVLNEVSFSGILWLMSHASRVLSQGGYFYIRDSSKLKPGRHSINYDRMLNQIGFVEVARLNVRNRIDYYGVPRVYQKKTDASYSFEELGESFLGKFAVTAHGGEYVQNLENMPKLKT